MKEAPLLRILCLEFRDSSSIFESTEERIDTVLFCFGGLKADTYWRKIKFSQILPNYSICYYKYTRMLNIITKFISIKLYLSLHCSIKGLVKRFSQTTAHVNLINYKWCKNAWIITLKFIWKRKWIMWIKSYSISK